MSAILIIQFEYDLKSQDFGKSNVISQLLTTTMGTKNWCVFNVARGIVAGIDTGITLSAKQCIEIGSHAIAKDYFYQAINWMETAVAKITSENDRTASLTEAEIQLETAKKVVRPVNT